MHEALYCSMLYRRKKVKSFQEGFAERRDLKLVLLDENRKVIESIFSKELLCDGSSARQQKSIASLVSQSLINDNT